MEQTSILGLLFGALDGSVPRDLFNREVRESGGLDLTGIELAHYDLRGLSFKNCVLKGADLSYVRADRVCFEHVVFDGGNFEKAVLAGANLQRSSGVQANMAGAEVTGADLTWCVLRGARLDGVDLNKATLWKTDLRDATYPDFAFRPEQDILRSYDDIPLEGRVPLRRFLEIVSELTGTDYELPGSAAGPKIEFCAELREDPAAELARVVRDLGLRVVPKQGKTGAIEAYEIVQ
ncbi:MAG: pentapeptide repeat-containing protein [Planctomycetota bacterium]